VTQARRAREKARFTRRLRQLLLLQVTEDLEWAEEQPGQAERLLQSALGQLTALEREAFVLYELEGQSGAELAAIFRCPEATVYRRLHDARKKFHSFIEGEAS
jgi:RNA polymerase sigma factor (sigma-70 family)